MAVGSAMDSKKMRKYLKGFSLKKCKHGSQGYKRVFIQLFGLTGHGKSSFINSCKYVVDDAPFRVYAKVAVAEDKPETMIRSSYRLTDTIKLVDNRGCVKLNKDETGEVYAQLGNFLPLDTEVEWDDGFEKTLKKILESDREDRSGDLIAPVFVYSCETRMAPGAHNELKEILLKARNITGIFPTVVLTHETSELLPEIQESFRRMGAKNIFSVENYTEQDFLKIRKKHETILQCLYNIIKDVEFRMQERRNPMVEMIARKEILHRFIIEREVERARERDDRERLRTRVEMLRKI